MGKESRPDNRNPLDYIKADIVAPAIVEVCRFVEAWLATFNR
jgi:hypothetical protein